MATLKPEIFITRFLLHELPAGFMRIRHYGFLGNRYKKENIQTIRALMKAPAPEKATQKTTVDLMLELTGIDLELCPYCKRGKIKPLWDFRKVKLKRNQPFQSRKPMDSS